MELETIEGVEILATGRYALETGETEFTPEHLADAVRAASDPTVVAPRIKLGHDFDKVFGDAAPAFGKVKNMRLAANGQKIVGDLTDVPKWLAASIAAHYPGRSIEGGFDFNAPSGHDYGLVISDLCLLGTEWPGVTNLKDLSVTDLEAIVTANGRIEHPVEADERFKLSGGTATTLVEAKLSDEKKVAAGLNVADFRKVFARDLKDGKVPTLSATDDPGKWWARSVEAGDDGRLSLVVDDDAGHLIEFPVEVSGDGLKYETPRLREAVAASGKNGPRVLASWPSKGTSPPNEERQSMKREQMLERLGLPEDATDAAIVTAMADKPDALNAETPAGDGEGAGTPEPAAPAAASGKAPEGFVLVDAQTFEQIKAGSAAGLDLQAKAAKDYRDAKITAGIEKGKFPAGRRDHYEKSWEADPEGTDKLIASLAEGLVPVTEVGRSGDGDAGSAESEDAIVAALEAQMLPELAASHTSTLARVIASTNGGAS